MIIFNGITRFRNRGEAARELAERLQHYKGTNSVVLAIPRGGVAIGCVVARELGLPLDIVLSKKIGHPDNPEYAIGSVTLQGMLLGTANVPTEYIIEETKRIRELLHKRYSMYMGNKQPISLAGKNVILVDDGIATGNTLLSTIDAIREQGPAGIVVGVPVASPDALESVEEKADETVCLLAPGYFFAVGQFYEEFHQLTDTEVIRLLDDAADTPADNRGAE